jgi:hypothetical protein
LETQSEGNPFRPKSSATNMCGRPNRSGLGWKGSIVIEWLALADLTGETNLRGIAVKAQITSDELLDLDRATAEYHILRRARSPASEKEPQLKRSPHQAGLLCNFLGRLARLGHHPHLQ